MRQEDNKEEKEVELGGSEPEVAARRRCRKTLARLVTHPVQPHGRPLPLHHQHLCLASTEVSLPLSKSEGDFVSRRSSGKKEGSRLFGEEEHRLERSSSHFKTKLGENISKKGKVS